MNEHYREDRPQRTQQHRQRQQYQRGPADQFHGQQHVDEISGHLRNQQMEHQRYQQGDYHEGQRGGQQSQGNHGGITDAVQEIVPGMGSEHGQQTHRGDQQNRHGEHWSGQQGSQQETHRQVGQRPGQQQRQHHGQRQDYSGQQQEQPGQRQQQGQDWDRQRRGQHGHQRGDHQQQQYQRDDQRGITDRIQEAVPGMEPDRGHSEYQPQYRDRQNQPRR